MRERKSIDGTADLSDTTPTAIITCPATNKLVALNSVIVANASTTPLTVTIKNNNVTRAKIYAPAGANAGFTLGDGPNFNGAAGQNWTATLSGSPSGGVVTVTGVGVVEPQGNQ